MDKERSQRGPQVRYRLIAPQTKPHKAFRASIVSAAASIVLIVTGSSAAQALTQDQENRSTEVIEGEYLTVTSESIPGSMTNLAPGDTALWDLGITSNPPGGEPGEIQAGINATGDLPLTLEIIACSDPWNAEAGGDATAEASCPGAHEVISESYSVPRDGDTRWLTDFTTDDDRWLRLEVSVPEDLTNEYQNRNTSIEVHVAAEGDYVSAPPPEDDPDDAEEPAPTPSPTEEAEEPDPEASEGPEDDDLATTGFGALWLLLLSLLGITAGALIAVWAKRRGRVRT